MDNDTAEPAANIRRTTSPMLYVPHEVVTKILLRLPVSTLLRVRRVCRAWRHTISEDPSFQHTHLHRHRTDLSLLIAPWSHDTNRNYLGGVAAGLYHWDQEFQDHPYGAATARELPEFVYCDGPVLVGTDSEVWVLNPTTRRIRALHRPLGILMAFGLGRDPRSNTYKVARFYLRTKHDPVRETATFNGSLIWIIGYRKHRYYSSTMGFLRMRLDDETFSLIPPPPCWSWDNQETSTLSELREELCLTTSRGLMNGALEMWVCTDLDKPRWEKQYQKTRKV